MLYVIREWTKNTSMNFPDENFGIADKFLLSRVVEEMALQFEKDNTPISSYVFTVAVRKEMQDRYGYKPKKISF